MSGITRISLGGLQRQKSERVTTQAWASQDQRRALSKLNELTHHPVVAQRLIDRVAEKNPGRTSLWCVEKAIYDIERDRT